MRVRAIAAFLLWLISLAPAASAAEFAKGPYLRDCTTTGVTIAWESDSVAPARVDYGPSGALGRTMKTRGRSKYAEVPIDGLEPGTTYYYKVTEGDRESSVYSFKTLRAEGPFTFAVYGDSRSRPMDHVKVVLAVAGKRPDFLLHLGDYVLDGRDASQWGPQFFGPAGPLIARVPVFAVIGNHEQESPLFYKYLGSHTGRSWYSFDCVNTHFAILDSCRKLSPDSEQGRWLVNDLASTTMPWKIVAFHHPLYSSGLMGSRMDLRQSIEPLLHKYGVDLVLNGHDHDYERTYPIVSAFGPLHPLTCVITGGGGAELASPRGDFYTAATREQLNFCTVEVNGNRLALRAFGTDGVQFDELAIVKEGDGYANGYPGRTAPLELAQLEADTEQSLATGLIEPVAGEVTSDVAFRFAAPEWSQLDLSLTSQQFRRKPLLSPMLSTIVIPAGRSAEAQFEATVGGFSIMCPSFAVTGRTSLGEFRFQTWPYRLRPDP